MDIVFYKEQHDGFFSGADIHGESGSAVIRQRGVDDHKVEGAVSGGPFGCTDAGDKVNRVVGGFGKEGSDGSVEIFSG